MTDQNPEYVPDGEAADEGLEAPAPEFQVPDDASSLTGGGPSAREAGLEAQVSERTADLQRLQAEYVNYKRRVDRDRALARQGGIEAVVLDLLPVLDSIEAAREHNELAGGFALVATELEKIAAKYGLEVFGDVGDVFDPTIHEALMHLPYAGEDELEVTTVSAVMQKGVRLDDRVLRPARVGVAEPA